MILIIMFEIINSLNSIKACNELNNAYYTETYINPILGHNYQYCIAYLCFRTFNLFKIYLLEYIYY